MRFSAIALAGANAGLDLEASAARYGDALRAALVADFPDAEVEVSRDDRAPSVVAETDDDAERLRIERSALDLAWVVKQCAPWSVPGG